MTSQGSIKTFGVSSSCGDTVGETFTGNLDLNVCTQNSLGGNSLEIIKFPSCANGDVAQLQRYDSSDCQGTPYTTGNKVNQCLSSDVSDNEGSLLFVCVDSSGNVVNPPSSAPSTTSSLSDSLSSGTALTTSSVGASSTSSSPQPATTSPKASTGPVSFTTLTSSTSSTLSNGGTTSATPSSNSNGLSTSDKIALGVGLGTGLPTIFLTIIGLYYAIKTYRRKRHR